MFVAFSRRCGRCRTGLRRSRLVAVLALVVLFTGCRADVAIDVEVAEDGSGQIETTTVLDAEATNRLLDLERDSDGLPLTDLAQSGWDVSPPELRADGSTVIVASKAFGSPSQFADLMDELTGASGPIRNFRLVRTKSFARVDYDLTGTLDTTGGLDAFSDPDLDAALGRTLADIGARYGATENDLALQLVVDLPGEAQGEAVAGVMSPEGDRSVARWEASFGDPEVTQVALGTATREVSALVLRGVAVVAGVLAAIVIFAQVLRILLPDRRRRSKRKRKRPPERSKPADQPPAPQRHVTQELPAIVVHKAVALDGRGVLYRESDDLRHLLIPFARERGSTATDDEILARVRSLSLGRMTTGEFWRSIGVEGEVDELDEAYVALHQLAPGVVKYLRSLRDKGVRVACITNDGAGWSNRLRARHSLDGLVDPWVVSGSVGVRKPDKPIFEVLRRLLALDAGAILVLDDDLDILDAAREQGFGTAWFSPEGRHAEARGHTLIRSFEVTVDDEPVEASEQA